MSAPRGGRGPAARASRPPFDDDHTCPCGGPLVRRRDGWPGLRCGRCGAPEPAARMVEVAFGPRWLPALVREVAR
ncbi:MAG TPA: hypothetical protein VNO79_15015 [Actinomycetota bacterium]|nr:hypothetical protein [Actinomycetota bacterium]